MTKPLLYILLLSLLACTSSPTRNDIIKIELNKIKDKKHFEDLFKFSHLIKLETKDDCLINKINKCIFYKGNIYILDIRNSSIFIFNSLGKHLITIYYQGNGPHEYLSAMDIEIFDDQIIILDLHGGSILKYDLEGNFIVKENTEKAQSIKYLSENRFILDMGWGIADGSKGKDYYSYKYYDNNSLAYETLPFNKSLTGRVYKFSQGNNTFFEYKNNLYYLAQFNDTIYTINRDNGKLIPSYFLDLKVKRPGPKSTKKEIQQFLSSDKNPSSLYCLYDFGQHLFLSYMNEKRYSLLFDKIGNINYHGNFLFDENELPVIPIPYTSDQYDEKLLNIVTSDDLLWITEKKRKERKNSTFLEEISKNSNIDDNPILIFYDLIAP